MAKRILIVDDHPAVRRAVTRVLESVPDFSVCGEAENGEAGVKKAIRLKPDLVVLDVSMPVMNGLEASRLLHKLMPNLPILLYTAYANRDLNEKAAAVGATRVTSKSNPSELIKDLRTLLSAA
jgi:DNA-binding NarL/FixJ family response regulator